MLRASETLLVLCPLVTTTTVRDAIQEKAGECCLYSRLDWNGRAFSLSIEGCSDLPALKQFMETLGCLSEPAV